MENNNAIIPGFDNEKDDSLTISLRKAEGVNRCIFIYLSGYIDTYNSSFFQKQITITCIRLKENFFIRLR